jgi:hypothetical protein
MPTIIYVSDPLGDRGVASSDHAEAASRAASAVGGDIQHMFSEIEGHPYETLGGVLGQMEGDYYVSAYHADIGRGSAAESRAAHGEEDKDLQIERMKAEIEKLERKLGDAAHSAKSFNAQQKKLYEGFKVLRMKYDDLKTDTAVTMWEYIPKKVSYCSLC